MKQKTTEEMMKEFFNKGGEVTKIPTVPYETSNRIISTTKSAPELKTLAEGELLYGEKKKVNVKKKIPNYSDIDMSLIPDHIKSIIKYPNNNQIKEGETNETDKDTRSPKTDDESQTK